MLFVFSASAEEAEKQVDVKPEVKPRVKQELITDHLKVEKKRKPHDRFNGTSKEELMTRTLPDRLKENLDIVFIGECDTFFKGFCVLAQCTYCVSQKKRI